jgi:uncharacterized protein GlcG (DUF336 family)
MTWNPEPITSAALHAADAACRECAEDILAAAVVIVPRDEGMLQDSGQVDQAAPCDYYVSFGRGMSAAYSIPQHEREDYKHSDPTRMARYLQIPFDQIAPNLQNRIAAAVARATGG